MKKKNVLKIFASSTVFSLGIAFSVYATEDINQSNQLEELVQEEY